MMLADWIRERSLIADALWQTTLLLAVGLVGARFLASRPARAHALLVACGLAALTAPLLSRVARGLGLGLWRAPAAGTLTGRPPLEGGVAAAADPSLADLLREVGPLAWLALSALFLIRLALGNVRARRIAARTGRPARPELEHLATSAARRCGLAPVPCVLEAELGVAPSVWAWSRPARLFLPEGSAPGELSAAIHHELGHLKRRDHLSGLALQVVAALLCWQPLAWIVRRRAAALAEQACDEWALACGVPPGAMARALISTVPAHAAPGLSLRRDRRLLEQRIERVFAAVRPRPRPGARWASLACGCVAALVAGIALAQGAAPSSPEAVHADAHADPHAGTHAVDAAAAAAAWTARIAELRAAGVVDVVAQPAEVDLGRVAPGSTPGGKLWLLNPGDSARAILGVKTGCGCTRVHLPDPAVVPAGGVLEIAVDQDAASEPDVAKSKLVTLRLEGQDPIQFPVKTHTLGREPEEHRP